MFRKLCMTLCMTWSCNLCMTRTMGLLAACNLYMTRTMGLLAALCVLLAPCAGGDAGMGFCPSPAIMQSSCPGAMAVCGRLAPPQSPPAAKSLRTGARARSRAPAMAAGGGADEWMFVDAKGLQKGARALREIEIGVLARPFGAQVVLGDERWIEVSSAADELLLASACQQRRRVAYTVGRASTSGTFANAQGFLAGTTASLLSVRDVQRSAGGGAARVLVRGEGRVVLQSVKTMKPSIMATAFLLRDGAIALLGCRPARCSCSRTALMSRHRVHARALKDGHEPANVHTHGVSV